MRKFACFLVLLSAAAMLSAAETWRWVDANGVVHYSDRPVPGAERVDLASRVVKPSEPAVRPATPRGGGTAAASTAPSFLPYTRCVVTNPANDQVFQGVQNIPVSLDVQPGLQGEHRIEVQLNGRVVGNWPSGSLNYSLTEVFRGSYSLAVRVLDEQGRQLCSGPVQTFHVRQPTLLSPARQGAAGG